MAQQYLPLARVSNDSSTETLRDTEPTESGGGDVHARETQRETAPLIAAALRYESSSEILEEAEMTESYAQSDRDSRAGQRETPPLAPYTHRDRNYRDRDYRDRQREAATFPPALRDALRVSLLPGWKRRVLTVPWYACSNGVFVLACLCYLGAAREWLRLSDSETAAAGEWSTYNRYTLTGAVLFVLEPWLDFAGAWCSAVFSLLRQAKWEWESGRSSEAVSGYAHMRQPQRCRRWVWTGYSVWDEGLRSPSLTACLLACLRPSLPRSLPPSPSFVVSLVPSCPVSVARTHFHLPSLCAVPSRTSQMSRDPNFWAAVFFLVASLFYLYQAAVPFL